MWQASYEDHNGKTCKFYQMPPDHKLSIYLPKIMPKIDPVCYLAVSGCQHFTTKIFRYLDSTALMAASLVCEEWQQFVFQHFYGNFKSRKKVLQNILNQQECIEKSSNLELKKTRSKVVDITTDDNYNMLILTLVSGTPHVMCSSMFTRGRLRWIHRFRDYFEPLTCISSGNSLVAMGSKYGKIYVYENIFESNMIHITAILAHHSSVVHSILFHGNQIISCSDDMTIGLVTMLSDGALVLSKLLQGHVSRVKTLAAQYDKIISGSDDRTAKLWTSDPDQNCTSLFTFSGHSGPITALTISTPIALTASGSTVRMWNIESGTCLKLLKHSVTSPILCMTLFPSFNGLFTIDTENMLRIFILNPQGQAQNKNCHNELIQEIITPSKSKQVDNINGFVVKLDAIPNQLSIISSQKIDCDFPCINLKILDFL